MNKIEIQQLINEQESIINDRQAKLSRKDYVASKLAEGAATAKEYSSVIAQKRGWRSDINAAEAEIARLRAIEPEVELPEVEE